MTVPRRRGLQRLKSRGPDDRRRGMPAHHPGGTGSRSVRHTLRRRAAPSLAALALAVGSTLGVAAASVWSGTAAAEKVFTFAGSGWGHGVGMSQWGARGMAASGSSATSILTHYYQGTSVTQTTEANDLRVLLSVSSSFALTGGGTTTVAGIGTFGSGATVNVGRSGNNIVLSGALNAVAGSTMVVYYAGTPLKITPPGNRYNHGLLFISLDSGGGLRAIVGALSTNAYLRGLGEVPSSWPTEALRAQAIAGRSIATAKATRAGRWDSDHDLKAWLDGAYIGYEKEYGYMGANWSSAVDSTNGWIVTYGGSVASTYYSASSGGHTENSEVVWGGSVPYLRGVPDSADLTGGNPHASWTASFTGSQMGAKLGTGTVSSVSISGSAGVSGRLDGATFTVTDTAGRTKSFTGGQMRTLLGLKSTRFTLDGAGASVRLPIGAFDDAFVHGRSTIVSAGRAGDPDGAVLVRVTDTVDGTVATRGTIATNGYFLDASTAVPGTHTICVSLFDNPTGQEVGLGCRQVVVK